MGDAFNVLNRVKLPGWILIVLFFMIVYIGIAQFTAEKASTTSKIVVDIETKMQESKEYTSFISIPTFAKEEINQPIHDWIFNQEKEFLKTIEVNKEFNDERAAGFRSHLNIKVDIEEVTDKLYNVIVESEQYTGGANGMSMIKGFTVDLSQKELLSIKDIFKNDADTFELLYTLVEQNLKVDDSRTMYVFEDLLEDTLKQWEDLEWSMNHKTLSFYFDKYEIAAGAAGAIKVDLPIEDLAPILTKDASNMFHIVGEDTEVDETVADEPDTKKEDTSSDEATKLEDESQLIDENIDPDGKFVALTFDDGPSAETTPKILSTLEDYHAKATFFMLGSQVDYYPEIARLVAEEGHEIANHTVNHLDLTVIDEEQAKKEIENAREMIRDVTGYDPVLVRPPYGSYNESIVNQATYHDESIILWSVDSLDWKNKDVNLIHNSILETVTSGSIVLMHDIHDTTAEALPLLLESLKDEGYQFVTVSQLLQLQGEEDVDVFFGVYN